MRLNVFRTLWQDPRLNAEGLEEPSEARFRTILLAIAALVIPPIVYIVFFRMMFTSLRNPDAMDLAQISRNLAHGQGFTTHLLRPLAIHSNPGQTVNPLHQPDVIHGPLYPFVQSLAFGILGASDNTAAWVSGLFFLLLIPLVYTLGKRVFNSRVGLTAACLTTVNSLLLEYAISGMHLTLFIFLTTCLMLALHNLATFVRDESSNPGGFPKGKIIWIGVLCALLYLTDSIFIWFAPVVLLFVMGLGGTKKSRFALFFLAPLLALTLPWMIRNAALTGNPVFGLRGMELWMNTRNHYPGDMAYRYGPEDLAQGKELFRSIAHKMMYGLGKIIDNFPQVNASWILAFLLPSLLFRFTDTAANSLRRIMMWCFMAILAGVLVFEVKMPTFVAIIPAMLVFSIAFLFHLMEQAQLRKSGTALTWALIVIAAVYPLFSKTLLDPRMPEMNERFAAKEFKKTARVNEVVLSDQPWMVAWYGERPSLWMPAIDGKIGSARNQLGARWMFLTNRVTQLPEEYSDYWKPVYNNLQRWQYQALQAEAMHAELPSRTPLAPQGRNIPLFDQLAPFQTIKQSPLQIDGKPSMPVAFIAEAPQPESRVGMAPSGDKQLAP